MADKPNKSVEDVKEELTDRSLLMPMIIEWLYVNDDAFDSKQEWRKALLDFLSESIDGAPPKYQPEVELDDDDEIFPDHDCGDDCIRYVRTKDYYPQPFSLGD